MPGRQMGYTRLEPRGHTETPLPNRFMSSISIIVIIIIITLVLVLVVLVVVVVVVVPLLLLYSLTIS